MLLLLLLLEGKMMAAMEYFLKVESTASFEADVDAEFAFRAKWRSLPRASE